MAPTADCRFADRCTRPDCTFRHPPWVECGKFGSKRCREGLSCANAKCGFAHPRSWPPLLQQVANESTLWVPCGAFGDRKCRDASRCSNKKCGFAHPPDWPHLAFQQAPAVQWVPCGKFGDKKCRDGAACRNAQCGFAHPHDWVHFHGQYGYSQPTGTAFFAAVPGSNFDSHHATMGLSEEELGWMAEAMVPGEHPSEEEMQWMQEAMAEHAAMMMAGGQAGGEGMMSSEEVAWLEAQMGDMTVSDHPMKADDEGQPLLMQGESGGRVMLRVTALTSSSVRLGIHARK